MIADVKLYARARMESLGYIEHEDAENFENVPAQALGRAFHIKLGEVSGGKNTLDSLDLEVPFVIRLFLKGQKNTLAAEETATAKLDEILDDMMAAAHRTQFNGVTNIAFKSAGVDPIDGSNDNALIVRAEFSAHVIMGTR